MRKRLMASGLVVIMALGLMACCNGKSSETEKNTAGRYMDQKETEPFG